MHVRLAALSHSLAARAPVPHRIADTVRDMIVSGELNPGDRVVESRLARQIGVGQPTVREALSLLEHQGLIARKPNQGCVVTKLSRVEIQQMLRIRSELETLAVELAIESASDEDLAALLTLSAQMKKHARARDIQAFFGTDVRFHETLWSLSGNTLLPRLLAQTLIPLLAFLFIRNLRRHRHFDMLGSAKAHVDLVQAIASRDKRRARNLAREKFKIFADQHLDWYEP